MSDTCSCTCHPHGNLRHPATGCCPCCPMPRSYGFAVSHEALGLEAPMTGPHPHNMPEEWRHDGKCLVQSCGVWRAGTAPTLDAALSTIKAGYCPTHGDRLTERGGCPEARREEPEVARGEHRALTDDVDGHIVTRTCSCGESFTTTSDLLPVVWADHINRSTNRPTLRQRVAYDIRDAHTNRPYRECNEEYMTPSGDQTEWWFTAADAVMEMLDGD